MISLNQCPVHCKGPEVFALSFLCSFLAGQADEAGSVGVVDPRRPERRSECLMGTDSFGIKFAGCANYATFGVWLGGNKYMQNVFNMFT